MIGKYIRGYQHLKKCVGNLNSAEILLLSSNRVYSGQVFCVGNEIYFFQSAYGERVGTWSFKSSNSSLMEFANKMSGIYPREVKISDKRILGELNWGIVLLPNSFNQDFDEFLNGNKKLLSSAVSKYSIKDEPTTRYFFALAHETPNLFLWAVNNMFKHHSDCCQIINMIKWYNTYGKSMASKLSKGTITAYNGYEGLEMLYKEASQIRATKRSNDVINTFNTTQKKVLKQMTFGDKETKVLSKFATLSNVKRTNFIQKMSTVEDGNEILHQMALVSNVHFDWNKSSFMDYINNNEVISCDVVYDKENIVLVKVKSYDTVKYLAKTTNWCISKNKRYWNEYVEHRNKATQFIIFNFDKAEDDELSIVGFTIKGDNGITNAHSFTNANLMGGASYDDGIDIESWFRSDGNIYDILKNNGIPLTSLMPCRASKYSWNKEGFVGYLEHCVNKDYDILMDSEDKLVVSVKNDSIYYFFGKPYDRLSEMGYSSRSKHIIFADFSKDETDSSRVLFGIIGEDGRNMEEYCDNVFNIMCREANVSFDSLLRKYGLPYDIICRVDDKFNRFYSALKRYDIEELGVMLTDAEIMQNVKKTQSPFSNRNSISEYISNSIYRKKTFALIDAFYNHGIKLCDVTNPHMLGDMARNIIHEICMRMHNMRTNEVPSETDLGLLMEHRLPQEKALCVGYFFTLKKILENETDTEFFNRVALYLPNVVGHKFISFIINAIYKKMNYSKNINDAIYNMVSTCRSIKKYDIFEDMLDIDMSDDVREFICQQIPQNHIFNLKFAKCGVNV